jgi:hypothetical protein
VDTKSVLKTSVAVAALFAVATPASAQEKTDNVTMMQKGVSVALYGQFNKSVQWADDGASGDRIAITDNDVSSTRWGLVIGAPINPNFSFGARLEVELQSNDSNNLTLNSGGGDNNFGQSNFCERIAEVTLNHKQFGTVSLGQGPTASDGTAEVDLSGTTVVALAANSTLTNLGAVRFTQDTAGHVVSGVQVNSAFNNLDGLSRQDRIRYDTPTIAGFRLSGSFISGGAADVGLIFGRKFGAFQVAAAASYFNTNSTSTVNDDGWAGSASVLHDSGINVSIAGGKQNTKSGLGRPDPDYIHGKIGYVARIFGVGPTSFAVDYSAHDDFAQANGIANITRSDGDSVGVTAVQMFSATGTEAYVSWRRWTFDSANTNYNDVNTVIGGVRVKF